MTIPSSTAARSGLLLILLLFGLASVPDAGAIVTRHDRDDESYRALAAGYPAAVAILPDGAGTLIAPHFVVTAAHVASGTLARNPRVVVGDREYGVERAFLHPGWTGHGAHDIALLRLREPVADAAPAALHRAKDEEGRIVTFVGSGDTGTGVTGPREMDGVRRAATNRVDEVDDDWIYFTFDEGEKATDLEGVSGPGDSGGPAFFETGGTLYLAGVSSHSFNGKPGRYGTREAYTRVATHADWIERIASGESKEPGIAPGESGTGGSPGQGAGKGALMRGAGPMQPLADVDGGELIEEYLTTYNGEEDAAMESFIDAHFSEAYRARKTMDELIGYYHRLLRDHVGKVTARGVVETSEEVIILRIAGSNGQEADFHFTIDANGRIDDMIVAIIDGAPRMSR